MNRKDAEKLADEIFDMIDRNHPRGLIKSELTDLLAKFDPGSDAVLPGNDFVAGMDQWMTLEDALSGMEIIPIDRSSPFQEDKTPEQLAEDIKTLQSIGYYFRPDQCGND